MFTALVNAFMEMCAKFFSWRTASVENQATTEVIKDKRKTTKKYERQEDLLFDMAVLLRKYMSLVVVAYLLSYNIFVTPVALERRLNEFNEHIETIYATKSETSRQQKQLDDIFLKIDKIYDYIIDKK